MRREIRHILLIPVLVWAGLLGLLVVTLNYAYLPAAPLKLVAGLCVAATKTSLIGAIFMQLRTAGPLLRVAAATGLFWLSLLFLFSFADFLTR